MLEISHHADVAVLKIAHGKANALDLELCRHITGRLEELGTSSVEAVVLTGQGGIFSAGVDLLRALDADAAYLRGFLPTLRKLFDVTFFYPKPVVAAINGHAIAGGCVLACAADQRLMARGPGRIGVTELLVGCRSRRLRSRSCGTPRSRSISAKWCSARAGIRPRPPRRAGSSTRWSSPTRCSRARSRRRDRSPRSRRRPSRSPRAKRASRCSIF